MKKSSITLALALSSASCALPGKQGTQANLPVAYEAAVIAPLIPVTDYTYRLLNPATTGLAQVFDDGSTTFLKFDTDAPPPGLMIFDENGMPLRFSVSGGAVVVNTVRTGWLVRSPSTSSYAQANSPARTAKIETFEGAATGASSLPADLAQARAEILAAERRLAGLSAELELAARGEGRTPVASIKGEIEAIQTQLNGLDATLLRAHFASGSTELQLSMSACQTLIEAARAAKGVRIEGGADSLGSPELNSRLALLRARRVRSLLVDAGIARGKLGIRALSGEYVASNATAAGRALNRRVDVIFINAGAEQAQLLKVSKSPMDSTQAD